MFQKSIIFPLRIFVRSQVSRFSALHRYIFFKKKSFCPRQINYLACIFNQPTEAGFLKILDLMPKPVVVAAAAPVAAEAAPASTASNGGQEGAPAEGGEGGEAGHTPPTEEEKVKSCVQRV